MLRRQRKGRHFEPVNIPILPVLESYGADISRVRTRGWSKIQCPFHSDSDPSASVNPTTNHFHCHVGCTDRTEDTIGLVMHIEQLGFLAAKSKAEAVAGPSDTGVRRERGASHDLFKGSWIR